MAPPAVGFTLQKYLQAKTTADGAMDASAVGLCAKKSKVAVYRYPPSESDAGCFIRLCGTDVCVAFIVVEIVSLGDEEKKRAL